MNDINAVIANLLEDMGEVQPATQSRMGYRRAAHAVLLLDRQISDLPTPGGELPRIPNVGPKSLQIVREVLESGSSPTVEAAVRASGKQKAIERRRSLRINFLSAAQVLSALADERLVGPTRADYRGDLRVHFPGDGTTTVGAIREACLARGYEYAALTDRAAGSSTRGALRAAAPASQRREIDRLNAEQSGRCVLLAAVEIDIGPDGLLPPGSGDLAAADLVIATPRSVLRRPGDQTAPILAAIRAPGVHILGNPRGRQRAVRRGLSANWDEVFAQAAESRVAIEIDGEPHRQDLDFELARRARDAGCVFALDGEADRAEELIFADIAIAHARLAGIPSDRVINTWPLGRLRDWLADRPAGRR